MTRLLGLPRIAGCATGEEAYSMDITALELMSKGGLSNRLNIIGSDLDAGSLEIARSGVYPESITTGLKPHLLARYFSKNDDGHFVVCQALRESVMFSQHNLLADRSRVDHLSTRAILILIYSLGFLKQRVKLIIS